MIEINLLPGDGKKRRRANSTKGLKFEIRPGDLFASLAAKITDKYMLGAVAAAGVCGALIVFMFIHQAAQASGLEERETKALKDSTPVSYTHLRAHETRHDLVCRLLL